MERGELSQKLLMQARKMTLSLAASVIVYGTVGYYLIQQGKAGPAILNAQSYPIAQYGGWSLAVVALFVMRRASLRMLAGAEASPVLERRPQKLLVATIVQCAAAEFAVLLGMVLMFLSHQVYDYLPFAIISLVGFTFAFPRKQAWSAWLGVNL